MQASELYLTSGDACDWLYGEKNVLAYTIELGSSEDGHNPPMDRVLNMSETHVYVNLYAAEIADNPGGEWVLREEEISEKAEGIFEDTPTSFAMMAVMIVAIFGITYGGLFKCFRIAIKSEGKKHGDMEK